MNRSQRTSVRSYVLCLMSKIRLCASSTSLCGRRVSLSLNPSQMYPLIFECWMTLLEALSPVLAWTFDRCVRRGTLAGNTKSEWRYKLYSHRSSEVTRSDISFRNFSRAFSSDGVEILLALGLLFFRTSPMCTMMEGSERDSTTFLIWHRMFEALLAGRPLQGLY